MCGFVSISEMVISYGYFYHVTALANVKGIEMCGLLTNKYPDNQYDKGAPFKKAQICFCPLSKLEEHKSSFGGITNENHIAVFKISAELLAKKDIGLDWTFVETISYKQTNEINWLKQSIDKLGTLCCFENIPFDELERVEIAETKSNVKTNRIPPFEQ